MVCSFVDLKWVNVVVPTQGDIRDAAALKEVLAGAAGAIFAVSATKGASPYDIDRDGAIGVARACIGSRVSHFVLVSAGGASKPNSPIFKCVLCQQHPEDDAYSDLKSRLYTKRALVPRPTA